MKHILIVACLFPAFVSLTHAQSISIKNGAVSIEADDVSIGAGEDGSAYINSKGGSIAAGADGSAVVESADGAGVSAGADGSAAARSAGGAGVSAAANGDVDLSGETGSTGGKYIPGDNVQHQNIEGNVINRAIGPGAVSTQTINDKQKVDRGTTISTTNGKTTYIKNQSQDAAADISSIDMDFVNAELGGQNFSAKNLTGKDFTNAVLSKANFSKAALKNANLTNADFSHANLSGANLTGANLINTDFSNADLTGANLTGAQNTNTDFSRANLTNAIWFDGKKCGQGSTGECR